MSGMWFGVWRGTGSDVDVDVDVDVDGRDADVDEEGVPVDEAIFGPGKSECGCGELVVVMASSSGFLLCGSESASSPLSSSLSSLWCWSPS
jgi:hypothetical protein